MLADKSLHITNGSVFTERLKPLHPNEIVLTWNEILCEGPCSLEIFSNTFIAERTEYLSAFDSNIKSNYKEFVDQFKVLNTAEFDTITLWFEYDLFCHINLSAVVSYLSQKKFQKPIFLVCSGEIETRNGLFGLGELTTEELKTEWHNKIELTSNDISLLQKFWEYYTQDSPLSMTALASKKAQLKYLTPCIESHFKRFPNKTSGLNALEEMTLRAISEHEFKNTKELVGYLLKHQEYYGFGDMQWFAIVERLKAFYSDIRTLALTRKGIAVLNSNHNVYSALKSDTQFGGSSKYDYLYNTSLQKLETL